MAACEDDGRRETLEAEVRRDDPSTDPLAMLEEEHRHQLELCDILEQIADGLPEEADAGLTCAAMTVLRSAMPQHQHTEERALFPILRERVTGDTRILQILEQLEQEHLTDEQLAYETADELETLIRHGRPANPDMLGYMLRGFFECQRRHIEWESAIILPLAREILGPGDLDRMRIAMADGAVGSTIAGPLRAAQTACRVEMESIAGSARGDTRL